MSHAIGRLGESFLLPNQICAVLSPLILQRIIVGDASYQQVDSRARILQDIALIFLAIPPPLFLESRDLVVKYIFQASEINRTVC